MPNSNDLLVTPTTTTPSPRHRVLAQLAEAIRDRGGRASSALENSAYPVLYVEHNGAATAVVAVSCADGWWLIWGRTSAMAASDVAAAADALTGSAAPSAPAEPTSAAASAVSRPPVRRLPPRSTNLVTRERDRLAAA
ncbi:hypothetical protein [Salinactinospora qingdaonensis]|uniref:Uncharacterized protein n=1 Tax=Salinactinospora qingdaonensis TaxID=702744 RepID=A0ABP7FDH0_9ACTN